ncbi:hypothetical protein EJ110_NYTH34908 [Nymphaea thermarum]|nr:hypothetical protein EJ110_NYTH34908 [Nymphaea thermarum]
MEKVMLLVTLGLLVALGASIAAGEKVRDARLNFPFSKQANCTYAIEIETTCTHGAGTTDPVSLRFGDSNGTDVLVRHLNPSLVKRVDRAAIQVLDDRPRQPFHECGLDVFQTVGPCVLSPVCYLYVKQLGADPWRPGYAHVRVLDNPSLSSSRLFYRTYLPRNVWNGQDVCDKVVTSFGIKHVRKVFSKSGRIHT